ncbi:hypothetical protein [Streptomyces sp. NPDC001250]|uniref:hypothetical protein n=1 Tax=unclassified Streptomyces TaxID=2593676 RepID=UPI00331D7C5F
MTELSNSTIAGTFDAIVVGPPEGRPVLQEVPKTLSRLLPQRPRTHCEYRTTTHIPLIDSPKR